MNFLCVQQNFTVTANKMKVSMEQVDKLLHTLDSDNSGKVDADELMAVMENFGIDQALVKSFIAEHDKDGDGCLDRQELYDFFQGL